MMLNPLISVVLPTYNVSLYIKEAINSILNQTIQYFEIIVIDDGSTDDTVTIIEAFNDARIKLIKKPINKGLIDSLNIGFKEAKGKYIARMDGDDISLPTRFEKQLHVLENNPEIDACGCWLQCFGVDSKIIKHKEFHEEIKAQLLLGNSMSLGTVMLKRNAFENYLFDKTKVHVEDYDFWARTVWDCKMYNIQEVLYYYCTHEKQVSTKYKTIQLQGDIGIKLFLFKKLNYDTNLYTDELIRKMLLLDKYIQVKEFILFINWLKNIVILNIENKVFLQKELEKVLVEIHKSLIFTLYFRQTHIGINKKWRVQALFKLPIKDVLYILKLKIREIIKLLFKVKRS